MDIERMEEDRLLMESLRAEGLCCTQIILKTFLDRMGKENEMLLRAASALCRGLKTGQNCGALSGAAMAMALIDSRMSNVMVKELVHKFKEAYGSLNCFEIAGSNGEKRLEICPVLTQETYIMALEIAEQYGFSV